MHTSARHLLSAASLCIAASSTLLAETSAPATAPAKPAAGVAKTEKAPRPTRLFMGVELMPVDTPTRILFKMKATGGMLIHGIAPGSPADGTLGQGDILLSVDGEPVTGVFQLRALLKKKKTGDSVVCAILRGGRAESHTLKLAEAPATTLTLGSPTLRTPDDMPAMVEKLRERTRKLMESDGHLSPEELEALAGDATTIRIPDLTSRGIRSTTVITRPEGRITLTEENGKRKALVKTTDGETLLDGEPTKAALGSLPEWAREAIENNRLTLDIQVKTGPGSSADEPLPLGK